MQITCVRVRTDYTSMENHVVNKNIILILIQLKKIKWFLVIQKSFNHLIIIARLVHNAIQMSLFFVQTDTASIRLSLDKC